MTQNDYTSDAVRLLEELISTPSVSREETRAADLLAQRMGEYGLSYERKGNNIWSIGLGFDERRETVLLNAHIDTVRPTRGNATHIRPLTRATACTVWGATTAVADW